MQKHFKKVLALFLSAIMVIGLIPSWAAPVYAADGDGTQTDVTAYVLDASTLSADDFGGYGTKISADMTLGTNGFFTLYSAGSKNSLSDLSAAPLEAENGTYSQAVNLGGGLKTSGQAGLGFTLDKAAKVTIYVAVKAVNDKHSVQISKDGASPETIFDMVNDTSTVNKIELQLEPGTYLLGGNNGGNFLYVEVAYTRPDYAIIGEELSADLFGSDNKLLADSSIGTDSYFKVTTTGSKVKRQTGQSITYGDKTYTTSLRLDGGAKYNTGQATVEFTAANPVRVTILAAKKGSSDSQLQYSADNGATVVDIGDELLTTNGVIVEYSVELPAGTYRFGGTQGVDYFLFDVQEIGLYEVDGNSISDTIATDTSLTADTKVGSEDFFTLSGTGSKIKIGTTELTYDGTTYSKNIYLTGGAKYTSGQATVSFTTAQTARITVLAAAKSDAASTLTYAYNGATSGTELGALQYGAVSEYVINNAKPGSYMLGGTNGAFIVDIKVEYDPLDREVTPWDEVPTPSITSVTTDEEGKLVVTFDAVIDKYTGAEKITVVMLENGYEFATVDVASQSTTSVTFSPIWNSDYTFKVVAQRTGEAFKESAEYDFQGYVLPVKQPIVELAQNRGSGTVYLDWINVEAADCFNVYYSEAGTGAYTQVVSGTAEGDIEITGLTAGKNYDFKIEAVRNSDNYVSTYVLDNFTVTENAENKWYFATVGSAQETDATVYNADGSVNTTVYMATKDETVDKVGITDPQVDIVNTDKYIYFEPHGNGKISDGEEGFQYYYTMLDPNTQNFELTAIFEVIKQYGNAWDNQTGYGIIATDMLGYNYYETDGLWYKHKQLNSVSIQQYATKGFIGMRNISGYTSCDTTSVEGVTRTTEEFQFQNTAAATEVGTTYTFTLKKTNDAWVAVLNGEEISYENLAITSVQEDGSICVGVFASRNAGVTIKDIKFTTSESTGVTAVAKDEAVTPNAAILSSNTANSSTYELVYHPNVAGKLTVTAPDGSVVFDEEVAALDVVRVPVSVSVGNNEIKSTLVPDESQNLTSYDPVNKTTKVEYQVIGSVESILYVSPDGNADGDGTRENPLDIYTAVKYAQPGQYIVLLNGTYTGTNVTIGRSVSGTEDKPITMVAEDVNGVVFEGIGLTVVGSYWHIYGIYIHYPNSVGIQISGNYNTIEMCTVEGSANTGVQISRSGSVDREAGLANLLWPSYNLIKNCESFDNCDAGRNDADGFAAKLTCGEGNVFYGCIAHNNIDDGWDLFAKAISGEIGKVVIENCVAYNNGWLTYEDTTAEGYEFGEGNGFKLGGNDMYGGHVLINSVSFNNMGKGITSNSCPDCEVYNSTSYGNAVKDDASYNFSIQTKATNHQRWIVEGLISVTSYEAEADQIPFSLITENNYVFDGKKSYNSLGVEVSDSWFESVDVSVVPTRNEDGTINMHGVLVPNADCPSDAGGRIDTSAKSMSLIPMSVNGIDYSVVFDPGYYMENNEDVVNTFGAETLELFAHFVDYGMAEGRQGNEEFNVDSYRMNYADLSEAFGDNKKAYYAHWVQYGKAEGRTATGLFVVDGVDYSAVYNADCYAALNPDVAEAYGNDPEMLLAHFINCGMKEGRIASEEFDIYAYKNNYRDLYEAFGDDNEKYYVHYCEFGKAEGRNAVTTSYTTVNGLDFSLVFDAEYYAASYEDLAQTFGTDGEKLFEHFLTYGMSEGRQAIESFNVHVYRDNYGDLSESFGDDLPAYYEHYVHYGVAEGRTGAEAVVPPVVAVTEYEGVDYAPVYDMEYYLANNSDVAEAIGAEPAEVLKHFVTYGMSEGRQAIESFNVQLYKNNYQDLNDAFGDNLAAYYTHYLEYGIAEGRTGAEAVEVIPPAVSTTVYEGVDYAPVYNLEYYLANNSDVAEAIGTDPAEVLKHFVTCGMSEGRQGNEAFNPLAYKAVNPDVAEAYGDDLTMYYLHYIVNGQAENRPLN